MIFSPQRRNIADMSLSNFHEINVFGQVTIVRAVHNDMNGRQIMNDQFYLMHRMELTPGKQIGLKLVQRCLVAL
jgi:hypothetical protein